MIETENTKNKDKIEKIKRFQIVMIFLCDCYSIYLIN